MRKKSKKVGQLVIGEPNQTVNLASKEILFFSMILFLAIGVSIAVYKRKQSDSTLNDESASGTSEVDIYIERLLLFENQVLDTEQLDKLIDIELVENIDSKRIKRARRIAKVNEIYCEKEGKNLIIREKNPDDKRYISYRIVR